MIMMGHIDKWICESFLYLDFKQKEKGEDKFFRFALLLVLGLTVILNFISLKFIVDLPEFISHIAVSIFLSFVVLFLLYRRYHYNDNYILLSKKNGYKKKLWGTAVIYIIFTFALMWTMIIYAVYTE
jgi:hypothetical protein